LPYGYWDGDPTPTIGNQVYNPVYAGDWSTLISGELVSRLSNSYTGQANATNGQMASVRKLFLDVDSQLGDGSIQYSCHPRIMPNLSLSLNDGTTYKGCVPYHIAHISRSAEIVMLMDGELISYNSTANNGSPDSNFWASLATAQNADGGRFYPSTPTQPDYFLFGYAPSGTVISDDGVPINPGINQDTANGAAGDIRWRHLNNTAANFLMVDGHVETHTIKPNPAGATKSPPQPYTTDLLGKAFNVNP
jgi:prepilin-type processing-associated H-X9-DG protein